MSLKIVGGIYKGLLLKTPNSLQIRPTSEKVRAAFFNILQGEFEGAKVLDLYAGSGAVGIEALSRGAREVVFVESSHKAFICLKENIENLSKYQDHLPLSSVKITYLKGKVEELFDLLVYKNSNTLFDIIWADPPYDLASQVAGFLASNVHKILKVNGFFAIETNLYNVSNYRIAFDKINFFKIIKEKTYGDTVIMIWEKILS